MIYRMSRDSFENMEYSDGVFVRKIHDYEVVGDNDYFDAWCSRFKDVNRLLPCSESSLIAKIAFIRLHCLNQ